MFDREVLPHAKVENLRPSPVPDVVQSEGQPLDAQLRAEAEPAFAHDFSHVRVHAGPAAEASAQNLHARAYTIGNDIVLGNDLAGPHEKDRLLTHELAHVVQQSGAPVAGQASLVELGKPNTAPEAEAESVTRLQGQRQARPAPQSRLTARLIQRVPTSLATIPEAERKTIQVSVKRIDLPKATLDPLFPSAPGKKSASSFSVGATTVFDSAIPPALQGGLASVGAYMAGFTNALPLNNLINIALDLTPYGGPNAVYRFTYFTHAENQKSTAIMLIEQVGGVPAAPSPVTATAGPFTVGGKTFTLGSGFTDARFGLLQHALGLLPANALTAAEKLTFKASSSAGTGDEAGKYHASSDTVELFSNAFPATATRAGSSDLAEEAILHEVGHALDLRPLEQAWKKFDTAGQTETAKKTLLGERSPSGTRYKAPTKTEPDFTQDTALAANDGEFRAAVQKDGVARDTTGRTTTSGSTAGLKGGITSYSDTDYQELFAELFALYTTDKATLKLLRPSAFAYFEKRYP